MEDKKFCKFCGEQIDKESIVCPKCGRQLQNIKDKQENKTDNKEVNNVAKSKFYEQTWFMWVMLIFFAPVGIFFMWKFHPEMKKNTKIILTVVFAILFIIIMASSGSETDDNSGSTTKYETNKKIEVIVVDFSSMDRTSIDSWCNEKKVNCKITDEYSDTVAKGSFVSQSVSANTTIYEGDSINIVYSLGKKPTISQKNALKSAKSYLSFSAFSYNGLIKQLEYEEYSHEDAVYAVDNCGADWNEQAVKSAKSYLSFSSFSKNGLIKQLEYEGFTHEQAVYGAEQNGL